MPTLPTPNKSPGDGAPADDINLIIEAVNTLQSAVDNISAGPQGPQGEPGTPGAAGANASVTVGSTTTGAPGSSAAVTNSGTEQNAVFNFTIPRGEKGDTGAQGPQGDIGPTGATGAPGAPGAGVKVGGLTGQVLQKASNTDFDTVWAFPANAPVSSVDGRVGAVTLDDLYDPLGSGAAAEDYADSLAVNYDPAGSAAAAQAAAESYADGLAVNYDPAGSAAAAQAAAESYADGLAVNYDPAGSAAAAQAAAESYADGLAVNYDPAGSAAAAQAAAEGYADSLAVNYDPAGSAAAAQAAAEGYADSLAVNYDPAGSAAAAQAAAEGYADSLAANYDPAGSAAAVAGDLSAHEMATTTVHGIADTSALIVSGDVHLVTFVTSSTRPSTPTEGQIIYETDTNLYYGWKGSAWSPIGGGATGGGTDDVFYENAQTVTASYTITSGKNAMSAGPITIDSGVTVTVPSGSYWTVV